MSQNGFATARKVQPVFWILHPNSHTKVTWVHVPSLFEAARLSSLRLKKWNFTQVKWKVYVLCHFWGMGWGYAMVGAWEHGHAHIMQIHQPVLSLLCHLRVMLSTRGVFFGPHPMHHVYCLLACILYYNLPLGISNKNHFLILFSCQWSHRFQF